VKGGGKARQRKLAINRLRGRITRLQAEGSPVEDTIDRFLRLHEFPIVEQQRCTFVVRAEADAVFLRHRVVGLPGELPLRRIRGTDVWYVVVEIPADSRVEYQFELRRGDFWERFNDPLNPRLARSPVGNSSACFGFGYQVPDWTRFDPEPGRGSLSIGPCTARRSGGTTGSRSTCRLAIDRRPGTRC
jgi:hypothetical protein